MSILESFIHREGREKPKNLSRKELKDVVYALAKDRGIHPETIEPFLRHDPRSWGKHAIRTMALLAPFIAGGVVNLIKQNFGIHGPEFEQLSFFIDGAAQVIGIPPAPEAKYAIDIIPAIFSVLALGSVIEWLVSKSLSTKIRETQEAIKKLLEEGELEIEMAEGHTALFSGGGDYLASLLQEKMQKNKCMNYSMQRPEDEVPVWQQLKTEEGDEEFDRILERGQFEKAGSAILFPVKKEEMFLPPDEDASHDMGLADIEAMIVRLDGFCGEKGISPKRITIVGSQDLSADYTSSAKGVTKRRTLREMVAAMNESRGENTIGIADPTEIIMKILKEKIGDKFAAFDAEGTQDEGDFGKYFPLFKVQAKKIGIKLATPDTPEDQIIHVHYNTTDMPSIHSAGIKTRGDKKSIVILLDPHMVDLANRNVGAENVLLVPEIVNQRISLLTSMGSA